jgi:arsenite methyltransferase
VFLAATKVGATGRAIGVDMTPEMIELARRNAAKRLEAGAPPNVEFHLSTIDALPLPDASADVVISNCVINLAPDKPAVFREMVRVLKPGGRLAISDIALRRPLPPELAASVEAYAGCVAGAIGIEDYRSALEEAGFAHVEIVDAKADLGAYALASGESSCCAPAPRAEAADEREASGSYGCCGTAPDASACSDPSSATDERAPLGELLERFDVNEYAASVRVFAVKGDGE